ncbi:MAG: hypothetical protein R3B49_10000 [Phycisphaerales bacterium]
MRASRRALGAAMAGLVAEDVQFSGNTVSLDMSTGSQSHSSRYTGVIYDNITGGAASGAFSSTDLAATWGDQLGTLGTGTVDACQFSVFNSGSSAGTLIDASFQINFYRASDSSFIGGFNTATVTFSGGGLSAGFYTTINVTGLSGLGIDLDTTDIIMTQHVLAQTGSTRLGFVFGGPLLAGTTSPSQVYLDATTVGAAGFYNITSGGNPVVADAFYSLTVVPSPATAGLLGLGGLLATRRRR